jgi:hypothetical protein
MLSILASMYEATTIALEHDNYCTCNTCKNYWNSLIEDQDVEKSEVTIIDKGIVCTSKNI